MSFHGPFRTFKSATTKVTPFVLYAREKRPQIKGSFGEVASRLSEMWKNEPNDVKAQYEQRADEINARGVHPPPGTLFGLKANRNTDDQNQDDIVELPQPPNNQNDNDDVKKQLPKKIIENDPQPANDVNKATAPAPKKINKNFPMKEIQFSPSKIFSCSALVKDGQEEFEIIYNKSKSLKMKKFDAILISNLFYRIISTDVTCSSYELQSCVDEKTVTDFFSQISSTKFELSLEKADQYLQIAKELDMPEVIEAIKFNSSLQFAQQLEVPLIFFDYKSMLQSIAKNIKNIPPKWLLSIPTPFIVDIYDEFPDFDDWNTYTCSIISHKLPVDYLNDIPIAELDISTIELLINYYVEMNSQERVTEIALVLANMAQKLKDENTQLNILIKDGISFDRDIDCSFIRSGNGYINDNFWVCKDCCGRNQIICKACKDKCHKGHNVVPYNGNHGYCDCGAGELNCKCQCMGRKDYIKVDRPDLNDGPNRRSAALSALFH